MYGTKAETLITLQKRNVEIPPFYCIPSVTLKKLSDSETRDKVVLEFLDWKKQTGVRSVAVRSSSDEEDTKTKSFAGQLVTVLDISSPDDFLNALNEVAKAVPAKVYADGEITTHALIQAFIEPSSAGVCFSIQPATGSQDLLINTVKGRGKKAVDGDEVDTYVVNRFSLRILSRSGRTKSLSKNECRSLSKIVLQIERILEHPVDVEWAIKDKKIWILQARPITKINTLQVWDSSNISESFPGLISPLTFSIARVGYGLVYRSQANKAGMGWLSLEEKGRVFDSMLGIFQGRMYYNLLQWYRYIGLFPGNSRNQKYLDKQIQTMGEAVYLPSVHQDFFYTLRFYLMLLRRIVMFGHEQKRYVSTLTHLFAEFEQLPKADDPFLLLEKYLFLEKNVLPRMGSAVDNDYFVMVYNGLLQSLIKRSLGNSDTSQLLGQMKEVVSADQALLLYEIALAIKNNAKAYEKLLQKQYDALDEYLVGSKSEELILRYKKEFGYRFAEEQKIEVPNPLLTREGLYHLLATYTKLNTETLEKRLSTTQRIKTKEERIIERKLNFPRRMLFYFLRNRLMHHLRIRERNRLLRSRVFAYCREIFSDLGQILARDGIILDSSDIYYLEVDEIYRFLFGMLSEESVSEIITMRKKQYKLYEKESPPNRFVTTSYPYKEKRNISSTMINSPKRNPKSLSGTISSPGDVTGIVVRLTRPDIPDTPFDILVTTHTDPGWTPLIALAKGVIVERGGILSHAAIITRELGIPAMIGVEGASTVLKTGMKVRINTAKSVVEIV